MSKLEGKTKTATIWRWHDPIYEKFLIATRKLLELNEFGKVAGYKINSEKPLAFVATLMNLEIIILSKSDR